MQPMTKHARVDAAVRGEAVDRPPVSLWRHFYESEDTAEGLADSMLRWQQTYDWDWLKINPRASYHVEGWGVRLKFSGQPLIKPVVLDYPIKSVRDWASLKPLPLDSGPLAEQLEAVQRIRQGLGPDVYAIETVFNPLSIAGGLVEGEGAALLDHMRQDPQAIHAILDLITETFCDFSRRVCQAGADGLFFATTSWATYNTMTDDQYAEYGRPYDLRILEAVKDAPFNVLHVCNTNNMLKALGDYPAHAVNWAVGGPGNPTLAEALSMTAMGLIGGLKNETLQLGDTHGIQAEAQASAEVTQGRRWMLGPACSIAVETPHEAVWAARQAVEAV